MFRRGICWGRDRLSSFSLRELLERPRPLTQTVTVGSGRTASRLGPGIADDTAYLLHDGRMRLPGHGPALRTLVEALAVAVPPPVPEHLHDSAWAALLGGPGFRFRMQPPASADPWDVHPASADERVDRVGLVAVAAAEGEGFQAGAVDERLAVLGVLTLRSETGGEPVEAWLTTRWVTSTLALVDTMCSAHPFAAPDYLLPSKSVTLLFAPAVSGDFALLDLARLRLRAAHLGLSLDIVDRGSMDAHSVRTRIGGSSGVHLVCIGPRDHVSVELEAAFAAAGRGKSVSWIIPGARRLEDDLVDRLLSAAGFDASLHPLVPPAVASPASTVRPVLPVSDPRECRHHRKTQRVYVRDGADDTWWTRDADGHGGSVFKTYRETDGWMNHIADHDEHGAVVNKHKGPSGLRMAVTEFHSCPRPQKHLP